MKIDERVIDEDNLEKKTSELPKRQFTTKSSKSIQNILNWQHKQNKFSSIENIIKNIKSSRAAVHARVYGLAIFKTLNLCGCSTRTCALPRHNSM